MEIVILLFALPIIIFVLLLSFNKSFQKFIDQKILVHFIKIEEDVAKEEIKIEKKGLPKKEQDEKKEAEAENSQYYTRTITKNNFQNETYSNSNKDEQNENIEEETFFMFEGEVDKMESLYNDLNNYFSTPIIKHALKENSIPLTNSTVDDGVVSYLKTKKEEIEGKLNTANFAGEEIEAFLIDSLEIDLNRTIRNLKKTSDNDIFMAFLHGLIKFNNVLLKTK